VSDNIGDRIGTVASVNDDGTVNVWLGDGYIPGMQSLDSYLERVIGDRVLVRVRDAQMIVVGRTGPAVTIPTVMDMTLSDSSAPAGQGWREIVSGQVWAKPGPPGSLWMKHYVPYVPPPPTITTPATLSKVATDADTYRSGSRQVRGYGEQGDYSGLGMQTGVWVFGASAWAPLSGKTVDGCSVDVRRRSTGHGFTYGPVNIVFRLHNAGASLPTGTPALADPYVPGSLGLGEAKHFVLPVDWGARLRDGTASGIAIHTDNARENLEADLGLTLNVAYH
jgi:hypothetical protein